MDHPTCTLLQTLRDGRPVLLRPIVPADRQRLEDLLASLSSQSRQRRFLSPTAKLSTRELRYLTEVDYERHMAWIALEPTHPAERALGVARYIRLPGNPTVAEAAVVVADDCQRLGLGTLLLTALCASAAERGIDRFRALVATDNGPMRAMLRELQATILAVEGLTLEIEVAVPASEEHYPDTPTGRTFRAAARDLLPRFRKASGVSSLASSA